MELILDTAISNNCTQDEMPKNIIIISDMQFDNTRYHNFHWNKTLFEVISDEYKAWIFTSKDYLLECKC